MSEEFICCESERKAFFEKFSSDHPADTCGIIGRSILGRDIHYFKLGCGKRKIIIVGAHHGKEYISAAVAYDLIEFLTEKATRGGIWCGVNLQILLQLFTFWIIPCINPDGVELCISGISKTPLYERQVRMNGGSLDFSDWQANARGVDLNHNYGAGFLEYKRIEHSENIMPGKTRFSGEYPESEPEVRSMANLVRVLMPDAVVSLHTQGKEIYSSPRTERVARMAERIAEAVGYKAVYPEGHAEYGGLCDYTGGELMIPSFTVELGMGKNPLPHETYQGLCIAARTIIVTLCKHL